MQASREHACRAKTKPDKPLSANLAFALQLLEKLRSRLVGVVGYLRRPPSTSHSLDVEGVLPEVQELFVGSTAPSWLTVGFPINDQRCHLKAQALKTR